MIPTIVYPVPFDNWGEFERYVERFTAAFKANPPGCEYRLLAVGNWGQPTDHVKEYFYGIKTVWMTYNGWGCDMGSWKHAAIGSLKDEFFICCTSRVYPYREGWVAKIMEARRQGPGFYATSSSKEGEPHACQRCYGIDAKFLETYPHAFISRPPECRSLEVGTNSVSTHVEKEGGTVRIVMWGGDYTVEDSLKVDNRFRHGDQSNLLVWDRHSDIYKEADEEEKKRLAALTYGE